MVHIILLLEYIASFPNLDPCKLYCQIKGGNAGLRVFEDHVSNGVSCQMTGYSTKGVCIDGQCIQVTDNNYYYYYYYYYYTNNRLGVMVILIQSLILMFVV